MLYFSKWKTIIILGLVALGFLFALPNALPEKTTQNLRDTVRGALGDAGRIRTEYLRVEDGAVVGKFAKADEIDAGYKALDSVPTQVDATQIAGPKDSKVERIAPDRFRVTITKDKVEAVQKRTIERMAAVR